MSVTSTPSHQGHTRDMDLSTPSQGRYRAHKTNLMQVFAPEIVQYGGERTTNSATSSLKTAIEASLSEAKKMEQMLSKFASLTDKFAGQYIDQEEQLLVNLISSRVSATLAELYNERYNPSREVPSTRANNAPQKPSYAEATRKKAPPGPQTRSTQLTTQKPASKQTLKSRVDLRVLVTAEERSLIRLRKEEPFILRQRLVKSIAGLAYNKIKQVTHTPTGWAVHTVDLATKESLLTDENKPLVIAAFQAKDVLSPENWFTYAVPNVPSAMLSILDNQQQLVDENLVRQEVLLQAGEDPVRCNPSKNGHNAATGKATWIISFKKEVKAFTLFGSSAWSSQVKRRVKITHHKDGCQKWCNQLKCKRETLCQNCGVPTKRHDGPSGNECTAETRCVNCCGPHKAGSEICPATPKALHGRIIRPTKNELRRIRQAGSLATQAARKTNRQPSTPTRSNPGATFTPVSSTGSQPSLNGNSPAGEVGVGSNSPSPEPASVGRKRPGQTVQNHEDGVLPTTETPDSSARPVRSGKFAGNVNVKKMFKPANFFNPDSSSGSIMEIDTEETSA